MSGNPLGTWDTAVSETHTHFYPTAISILVSTQNTGVPISGHTVGRKLHKSRLFAGLRNCEVTTLWIPCVWFHCTHKDVTFGNETAWPRDRK